MNELQLRMYLIVMSRDECPGHQSAFLASMLMKFIFTVLNNHQYFAALSIIPYY